VGVVGCQARALFATKFDPQNIQWHHGCALDCFHGAGLDGLSGFEKIF
jgi:hypothetical protein